MHYEKLFEKGTIGRLELRNRVVMTAMGTMLGDWNGCSTPEQVRFYEERAKGGCGLIIPEFTSVDPDSGHCNRIQLGIWDARQISSFERICDAVHRHGAKIFVQLHHGGREAPPAINGGRQAMAPSVELNSVVGRDTILPREMTIEDIDRLVGLFIQAALNAQAAGADGVEIHGAHGYLLQQFMSPYTNKRTDEYGGSMENRCRFIVRILKGIREVVEPGFVVGARINGNDFVEGGNDQDACVEIAKYLEPYVDYIVGGAIIVIGICAAIGLKSAPVGYAPAGWKAKADDPKLAATQLESLTPGQAFRTRGYWHLFLGYGLFPTMYIICYPRFSVLISDAGYSLNAATIGVSIYSICNVIGRFGMGALIDKLGYRKVYTICGICSIASSVCLMFAHSLAMFYIAYVLLAVGFGATNCCHPVAVQETYGSKYAGGIFGICMLGYMIICTFISPKISSALVKATGGSYTASMIYAIIACIIAVVFYTTIPQPKRRTLAEVAAEEKAAQEKAAQA